MLNGNCIQHSASLASAATEFLLELLYSTGRIDETLFASIDRMRVHGYISDHLHMLNAINSLGLTSFDGGVRYELLPAGNVYENSWVIVWMDALFHWTKNKAINPGAP